MSTNRDAARRLAEEIKQMITNAETQVLDGYVWGLHDFEHLRDMVAGNEVEGLTAAKRVLLPLQREFNPGIIGSFVKNIRDLGVPNAGDLVTRESVARWQRLVGAMDEYDESLLSKPEAQEVFLMAFTDPGMSPDEIIGVVGERGLLPAETIRVLVVERRKGSPSLVEGVL